MATSSPAIDEGVQYEGDWQIKMHLESARDITAFSVKGENEIVLPRGVQLEYRGILGGYRTMHEKIEALTVKKSMQFSEREEEEIDALIGSGYTPERAIEILQEMRETQERWERERGQPRTEKQIKAMKDLYERMQVEATAGLE